MNVVEDKAHFQNALPLYSSLEGGQLKSHTEPLPSHEKRGLLSLIGARIYSLRGRVSSCPMEARDQAANVEVRSSMKPAARIMMQMGCVDAGDCIGWILSVPHHLLSDETLYDAREVMTGRTYELNSVLVDVVDLGSLSREEPESAQRVRVKDRGSALRKMSYR